jgi:hypothetical protein
VIAKSELEQAEKKAKRQKKNLQCIYGSDICNACPVRADLETQDDPFKNYMKQIPKNMGIEGLAEVFSGLGEAVHSKISVLSEFCSHCPYLDFYVGEHYRARRRRK